MDGIDKDSRIPLYFQLMEIIIKEIESKMKTDDQLPSEREFCERYDLSRSTVRQAFLELGKEGYIYKIHGKGTFVSPKKFNQDLLKFYSFTNEMKKIGKTPTSRMIEFAETVCDKSLAEKMKTRVGCRIYRFVRVRLADGRPMMIETSHIPCARFPNLTREMFDRQAMYDIFARGYQVEITYAEEKFQAVMTDEKTARYLNVKRVIPSLRIERFTYEKDVMIEYTVSMARGDHFVYSIKLDKKEID